MNVEIYLVHLLKYTTITSFDEFNAILNEICVVNRALVIIRANQKILWYRA